MSTYAKTGKKQQNCTSDAAVVWVPCSGPAPAKSLPQPPTTCGKLQQRGGRRDEVVLQLESELVAKETERADMEEQLSRAFGGVIAEAHGRVAQLTAERDKLLVQLEEQKKHKGAFHIR